MKAPDKAFPLSVVGDLLASMPDKIYFDGVDTALTPRLCINDEYVRKDKILDILENSEHLADAASKIDSL